MENVTFSKEPGMLFDLLSLFSLRFNKQYCLEHFTNPAKPANDSVYYNNLLKEFPLLRTIFVFFLNYPKVKRAFFLPIT